MAKKTLSEDELKAERTASKSAAPAEPLNIESLINKKIEAIIEKKISDVLEKMFQ